MIRKIIKIDETKCNGCGICATACHEGAIGIVDGKARLLREDYCDGLGDCLPTCPTSAITFEERESPAYDKEAVMKHMAEKENLAKNGMSQNELSKKEMAGDDRSKDGISPNNTTAKSQLTTWPVQIKLAAPIAPYFDGANLLIAADCTAYAYGNFHNDFMKNRVTLIGCPKLDMVDYTDKLTAIIANNEIQSVTVVRMEVPCCGGIEYATKQAIAKSGKFIPWQVVTISTQGEILK